MIQAAPVPVKIYKNEFAGLDEISNVQFLQSYHKLLITNHTAERVEENMKIRKGITKPPLTITYQ